MLHPDKPDTATPFAARARRLASLCVLTLTVGAGGVALAAAPATASTVTTPTAAATALPSAPLHVTASQTGAGQVTIRWSAPTSAGASPITGYVVGYSAGQWGNGEEVHSTVRSDVFNHLANGPYLFSVAAVSTDMGQRVSLPVTVTGLKTPTQAVSRTTVTAGDTITLSGLGSPGARLTLDRALPGQAFRPLATVTVDSRGHYARTVTVANTATYRSRGVTGLVSHANKVVAQDRMTFGAVRNAVRSYTLSGKVYPARKGQLVKLSYLNGSSYTPLATVSTDQYGRWSYKHTYNFTKTYTFKAVSAATTFNASKAVTLKVAVK